MFNCSKRQSVIFYDFLHTQVDFHIEWVYQKFANCRALEQVNTILSLEW